MTFTTTIADLAITVDVTHYHPGSPGHWNPRDGGSPPEGPEAEFQVYLVAEGNERLNITEFLPEATLDALHETAIEEMEAAGASDGLDDI